MKQGGEQKSTSSTMIIVAEKVQVEGLLVDRKSWPSTSCNISFY
jgi:hypothetical protein